MDGWIKLHRSLMNSICFKDSEMLHVWIFLLLEANHEGSKEMIGGKITTLPPGSMITSRQRISKFTGVQESKVERILKILKTEQQIEQESYSKCRVISIVNWPSYQNIEQQNEQQMNSKRTANEQQITTENDSGIDDKNPLNFEKMNTDKKQEVKSLKPIANQKPIRNPSGDHQLFFTYWKYAFKIVVGEEAYISGADQKAIQNMLKQIQVGRIIVCAAHFLLDEDEWIQGKKTITMLQTKIGGMPNYKDMDHVKMRDKKLLPENGIKISEWKFWD